MWLQGERDARWIATDCEEREVWKMMSPSRHADAEHNSAGQTHNSTKSSNARVS
jgi:hypothetical protein